MPSPELPAHAPALRRLALDSIAHGFAHARPLPVDPHAFAEALRAPAASFVTLRRGSALRGCVGALEATRPLVADVAAHAFAAAFRDPRFEPLVPGELAGLHVHLSVLGPLEPLEVVGEDDLVARLRPGEDGLVLVEGARRATFLPAVWESLPEPRAFVRELQRKAGLRPGHWTADIQVLRYAVQSLD